MVRQRARGGVAFGLWVFAMLIGWGCAGDGPAGSGGGEEATASVTSSAAVPVVESAEVRAAVEELRARFQVKAPVVPLDVVPGRGPGVGSEPRAVIQSGVATGFVREGERVRAVISADTRRGVARTASVELPAVASGAARLADDESKMAITFALEGAGEVPIAVSNGIARYAGALGGADVVHRVHAEGTEDFVVFEARPAREEIRYAVDVTRVAGLRLVGNTVEFLDEGGSPRLRVAPPSVVDASGAMHEATLGIEGCAYDTDPRGPWGRAVTRAGAARCVVRVEWSGVTYPALVDPAWTATGSMATARGLHTATRLGSGKVLIAGGDSGVATTASAELYDPSGSGTFAATGPMAVAREWHSATLLGSGKVLVTAGCGSHFCSPYLTTAELYNPLTGAFAPTGAMGTARGWPTATLLGTGKVLITGGDAGNGFVLSSAELYDPSGSGSFAATGSLVVGRFWHSATLLASGKVLIAGGRVNGGVSTAAAELYNPAGAGTFAATGPMAMARQQQAETLLSSGKVLITGGNDTGSPLASAEVYDPSGSGTFAATGPMGSARVRHAAARLVSGKVLVAGGMDGGYTTLSSADLYDPSGAGSFSPTGPMATARQFSTATLLVSGKVLVAGGFSASAELFAVVATGTACGGPGDCVSGVCDGGFCCAVACGTCLTCVAGTGACAPVVNADDPDSCAGTCDGASQCKAKTGQSCAVAGECLSGNCADAVCCNTACGGSCDRCDLTPGTCLPAPASALGANPTCAALCDGAQASCPSTCAVDADCAPAFYCASDSTCQARKAQGVGCDLMADCKVAGCRACSTNSCADGVCCDTACTTLCVACSAALKQSGTADGTCDTAIEGAPPKAPGCGVYTCDGASTSCATTCTSDLDCASSTYCGVGGTCTPRKGQGVTCNDHAGADCKADGCRVCASGNCNDGFCCDQPCTGNCDTCAAVLGATQDGTCTILPANTPGKPMCPGGLLCDGTHAACPGGCVTDTDCPLTSYCDGAGTCQPKKPLAASCTTGHECSKDYCADGVCCNSDCKGSCQACDLAPNIGACSNVTGAPHPSHPACVGTGTCAGSCDGSKSTCTYPSGTTECASTCDADNKETRSVCDSNGACIAGQAIGCSGGLACDADGHCRQACATESDCAKGFTCEAPTCVPKSGSTCLNNHTVVDSQQKASPCDPYVCSGGACKPMCTNVDDCVSPNICDETGACVPPSTSQADTASGCAVRPASGAEGSAGAVLLALGLTLAALRRRKLRHRSS